MQRYATCERTEKTVISQHNTLKILATKTDTISVISSKELLNDIFAKFDRSIQIKNFMTG